MFSLLALQSKGQNQKMLHLRNIESYMILKSDLDKVVFEKDQLEYRDILKLIALLPLLVN